MATITQRLSIQTNKVSTKITNGLQHIRSPTLRQVKPFVAWTTNNAQTSPNMYTAQTTIRNGKNTANYATCLSYTNYVAWHTKISMTSKYTGECNTRKCSNYHSLKDMQIGSNIYHHTQNQLTLATTYSFQDITDKKLTTDSRALLRTFI